ncbi:uncharacterized protein LTHEOB_12933 [Neofusicoccum parvum]|nr:uncharacterized protein LTHEOB_12933 [Neofusicoccum parvum]
MPVECAQLVFSEVDARAEAEVVKARKEGGEQLNVLAVVDAVKGKSKSAGKFVNEYLDRRAAMEFAYKNPNSTLAALAPPPQPFKSRYSDPNAHVNKHLLPLVTGGRVKAKPLGARKRWERAQRRQREQLARGELVKPAKRFLQEDVLFLMIVNMPSEEELAEARRNIAESKKGKSK